MRISLALKFSKIAIAVCKPLLGLVEDCQIWTCEIGFRRFVKLVVHVNVRMAHAYRV